MRRRRTGRTWDKGFRCISLQGERHQSGSWRRVDGNTQAPFHRMRPRMGDFKVPQSECKIFLHESSRQANTAENSPFQCGTFQSPNGTMAHSFISALRIGKCRWNLSSIYHLPNSNSVLFYVNTHEEGELQHNLDENLPS